MKKTDLIVLANSVGLRHISFKKNGIIRAMKPYYYRGQGGTTQALRESIVKAFPNAEILEDGDVFKPFIGGAPVAKQSHIWVDFKITE